MGNSILVTERKQRKFLSLVCFPLLLKEAPKNLPVDQKISEIETIFREKFPDLPVLNENSNLSPSSSSPDHKHLLDQPKSPPTGPPSSQAFSRPSYSLVVQMGLFRCQ
ncbi:hypothetical protein NPIL_436391 [Nephila pilipes]|uniref:Uncharacterized protein n=1 Tax=Nephila pilipes TaxID=299642 RepID=A0A8X6P8M6_NEPPI|nr:hypothetical protein NPIL_436391 [Nephila pilipes]